MQLLITEVSDLTLPGSKTLADLRLQLAGLTRVGTTYTVVDLEGKSHQFSLEGWKDRDPAKTLVRFAFYPEN